MAIHHAEPGEVVSVRPLADKLASSATHTLVKGETIEVLRMVLPAGKSIATHRAPGEITVQCLEGRVEFTVGGEVRQLEAGSLLWVESAGEHSLRALDDASLLVTMVLKPAGA